MIRPTPYKDEEARLKELESIQIMDSPPEEGYDYLTQMAAEICETPIALVSLLDDKRQWFKSRVGLAAQETPKDYAFCAHAIHQPDELFIVEDSRKDERFHDNPLDTGEPYVIYYAGVPLVTDEGLPLGTLCVIGNEPKKKPLTEKQKKILKNLASQVSNLINLRKEQIKLETALENLNELNIDLEKLSDDILSDSHSPLININRVAKFLIADKELKENSFRNRMVHSLHESSEELKEMFRTFRATKTFREKDKESKKVSM